MTLEAKHFADDLPLPDVSADSLNRATFAQRIAHILENLPPESPAIIGLHGPWGDGKSTILNMIREMLKHSKRCSCSELNPWRYLDESTLILELFRILADCSHSKLETTKEKRLEKVAEFLQGLAPLGDAFSGFKDLAQSLSKPSIEVLRGRIGEALKQSPQRAVILVDDIDRLDKHETHTLFRVIKSCASFPNVSYVLAFDDAIVAQTLGERYGGGDERSGRAFLEKIIQIPLRLPVADIDDLRALCLAEVSRVLELFGMGLNADEQSQYEDAFDSGIIARVGTPRAAKRYANRLTFAVPLLMKEVNIVDLLLIEALAEFYPEVYQVIRDAQSEYHGVDPDPSGALSSGSRSRQLLEDPLERLPDLERASAHTLLVRLFPRLNHFYSKSGVAYRDSSVPLWTNDKRICSPDFCSRYFSYSISQSDVSESSLQKLLQDAEARDIGATNQFFTNYFGSKRADAVITRLTSRASTVHSDAASTLAVSISMSATWLSTEATHSLFGQLSRTARLVCHLLEQVTLRDERLETAKGIIELASPLWVCWRVSRTVYLQWLHRRVTRNNSR